MFEILTGPSYSGPNCVVEYIALLSLCVTCHPTGIHGNNVTLAVDEAISQLSGLIE